MLYYFLKGIYMSSKRGRPARQMSEYKIIQIVMDFYRNPDYFKKLFGYLPNFSALHLMTFSIISSIYWLFCDDGEQQPKVSHFPSEQRR